jgi:hypothetical protein
MADPAVPRLAVDGDISVTQVREDGVLADHLRRYGGVLRLLKHTTPVGVVVSIDAWKQLEHLGERVEALEQRIEDDAVRALIAERRDHVRESGSGGADIQTFWNDYNAALRQREAE